MTSILTNISAMSALQTLRAVSTGLGETQERVSSGLRVGSASDNSAYWSISTTMRSDNMALAAVSDALGLGAAKVDTAYAGMEAVVDILGTFKARLVAATEDGVDKSKIQEELEQLKQQVVSVAKSSSFSGQNWLSTNVADIFDNSQNRESVVSSFVRGESGDVAVKRTEVSLSKVALFNSTGGGLLEADPRNLMSIGGLRFANTTTVGAAPYSTYSAGNRYGSAPYGQTFMFNGPLTFGATDQITFDIIVDAENPADPIAPPYNPGNTTNVVIDRALIDTVLPGANGVISNYKEYTAVLSEAISGAGAYATTFYRFDPPGQTTNWVDVPDEIGILYRGLSTLDGSSFQIANVVSSVGDAGVANMGSASFGVRRSSMSLTFERFTVFDDVSVSFQFRVNNEGYTSYSFDKADVNLLLGRDDGVVATPADMATLLNGLIGRSDIIIEQSGPDTINLRTDPVVDRKSGSKSSIGISGISVNIEPITTMNFLDIDVEAHPEFIDRYISYLEETTLRVVDGTALLGSLQTRIEMQMNFIHDLTANIDTGIGRLVDADMNEESARLKALQTQEQLAIQSLSIANTSADAIMQLFR